MAVHYERDWFKALDLAIENLCQPECSNVKIIGDDIIVVPPSHVDSSRVYIGTFDMNKCRGFRSSRSWLQETVKEAGITRPIKWIECIELRGNFSARKWIADRLGVRDEDCNYIDWTVGLMLEYAEADLL